MAELRRDVSPRIPALPAHLAYRVELWDGVSDEPEKLLAAAASSGMAYACYYAAVREHVGRVVRLRKAASVLAASKPPG